jgi:flagellar biosynthesis regulator FlbT
LKEKQCKDVVEYILWNDFVNDKGTLANKINATYRRYVWGDKVFVDFGMTNIQTELSYPHPAIILYNLANTVIVTPTTSDDKVVDFTDDINQCIIKVKKDGNIFPNDTIINLHQITAVHKERIKKSLNCNVKNYILDDDEIDRLNNYEKFHYFEYGINLLECIKTKLNLLFNQSLPDTFLEEYAYLYNEKVKLSNECEELKIKINELEKYFVNEAVVAKVDDR